MKTLSALEKTLISFDTTSVNNAQVLWLSPDTQFDSAYFLDNYAWVIPDDKLVNGPSKRFWADLYGGSEVAGNGGSARAGYDGEFQLKGIGPTPLVSRYRDRYHSDGCLCAFQAFSDAFWGRTLNSVLPYGAVQSHCIMVLPLSIPNDAYPVNTSRALLVRDAPVRLAHFDRALFYKPQEKIKSRLPIDSERTEINFQQIEDFLDNELSSTMRKCNNPQQAGRYLISALIHRLARQLAFCRASLIKLTTSASNVTINGALLDFNATSSAVPKLFRDRKIWDEQMRYLQSEWQNVLGSLKNISYLWFKYRGGEAEPYSSQQVEKLYSEEFMRWRIFYSLCRTGFPANLHATLPKNNLAKFITLYDRALILAPEALFANNGELPAVTRLTIALATGKEEIQDILCQHGSSTPGHAFLKGCLDLLQEANCHQLTAIAFSSFRQRCIDQRLDFQSFNEEFDNFNGPLSALMEKASARATFHLALDDGEHLSLLPGIYPSLTFCWQTGQLSFDHRLCDFNDLPAVIFDALHHYYDARVLELIETKNGTKHVI